MRGDGTISLGATTSRLSRDRGTLTDPGKLLTESFHNGQLRRGAGVDRA